MRAPRAGEGGREGRGECRARPAAEPCAHDACAGRERNHGLGWRLPAGERKPRTARARRKSGRRRARAPGKCAPPGGPRPDARRKAGLGGACVLPEPVEEGKAGRGRSAAVAANFEGWVGGAHSPPRVLLAPGVVAFPGYRSLAVVSRGGQSPGRGREEAGASGGRTVRTREGAGGSVWVRGWGWGGGRRPDREAGAAAGVGRRVEREAPGSRAQRGLRQVSRGRRGYLRGRGARWVPRPGAAEAAARLRLGAVQRGAGRVGRRERSRPGPARPCDPLYSCHHSGTFGAAPNGALGRPAPPPSPRPRGDRRAPRSTVRAAAAAAQGWFR